MRADGAAQFAERAGLLLGTKPRHLTVAGGQHGYRHLTATLADGRNAFIKAAHGPTPPPGGAAGASALRAEANGLRWLAEAGAVPLPEVLAAGADMLVIELLPHGGPSPDSACEFGQRGWALLVHVCLFGAGYAGQVRAAARAVLGG